MGNHQWLLLINESDFIFQSLRMDVQGNGTGSQITQSSKQRVDVNMHRYQSEGDVYVLDFTQLQSPERRCRCTSL